MKPGLLLTKFKLQLNACLLKHHGILELWLGIQQQFFCSHWSWLIPTYPQSIFDWSGTDVQTSSLILNLKLLNTLEMRNG